MLLTKCSLPRGVDEASLWLFIRGCLGLMVWRENLHVSRLPRGNNLLGNESWGKSPRWPRHYSRKQATPMQTVKPTLFVKDVQRLVFSARPRRALRGLAIVTSRCSISTDDIQDRRSAWIASCTRRWGTDLASSPCSSSLPAVRR